MSENKIVKRTEVKKGLFARLKDRREYWKKYQQEHKEHYKELKKEWKKNYPDKVSIQNRRNLRKLRLTTIKFLGGKCVWCGYSDVRALQIDHINGKGKHEIKKLGGYRAFYRRVMDHPEDYQLLCANCNWIKRYRNKEGVIDEWRVIDEHYS